MQIIVLLLQMIDDCVFSFDRQCERGVYYITIDSPSVSATITQVEKQEERLWSNSWTAIALTVNLVCAWLDNKIYHRFTRAVESCFGTCGAVGECRRKNKDVCFGLFSHL